MYNDKKFGILKTEKETLKHWLHLLLLGRALDDRAPNYLRQAIGWSYHAPYAGHDGIQLAIGQLFDRKNDHLFPYYRDMLTALSAGLTAEESYFKWHIESNRCSKWRTTYVQSFCKTGMEYS